MVTFGVLAKFHLVYLYSVILKLMQFFKKINFFQVVTSFPCFIECFSALWDVSSMNRATFFQGFVHFVITNTQKKAFSQQ